MANSTTDCRTPEGITVGLVDSLISIARVLAVRDLEPAAVVEALRDLRDDSDIRILLGIAQKEEE